MASEEAVVSQCICDRKIFNTYIDKLILAARQENLPKSGSVNLKKNYHYFKILFKMEMAYGGALRLSDILANGEKFASGEHDFERYKEMMELIKYDHVDIKE